MQKRGFFQTEGRFINLMRHVFKRGVLSNLQGSLKLGIELIEEPLFFGSELYRFYMVI